MTNLQRFSSITNAAIQGLIGKEDVGGRGGGLFPPLDHVLSMATIDAIGRRRAEAVTVANYTPRFAVRGEGRP
jgi:hypothetical protein